VEGGRWKNRNPKPKHTPHNGTPLARKLGWIQRLVEGADLKKGEKREIKWGKSLGKKLKKNSPPFLPGRSDIKKKKRNEVKHFMWGRERDKGKESGKESEGGRRFKTGEKKY